MKKIISLVVISLLFLSGYGYTEENAQSYFQKAKQFHLLKDNKQVFFWSKKAAESGLAKAQYNVGVMYALGKGVSKSMKNSKHWINKARENGYKKAD